MPERHKLDEYPFDGDTAEVELDLHGKLKPFTDDFIPLVRLHGGHGYIEERDLLLDAKQALSLLKWLAQNRETLEQLAKETQ